MAAGGNPDTTGERTSSRSPPAPRPRGSSSRLPCCTLSKPRPNRNWVEPAPAGRALYPQRLRIELHLAIPSSRFPAAVAPRGRLHALPPVGRRLSFVLAMPSRSRLSRTAFTVRPNRSASSASGMVPSSRSCCLVHSRPFQRPVGRKPSCRAVCRRRSTWSGGSFFPRITLPPASAAAWMSRWLPSVPARPSTPSALRQRQTDTLLTPHQCWIASTDSLRTARASSSSTSRPEPPPCVSSRRQRGHEMRASDQLVMTTVPSLKRHVVRSPLCRGGGVYGPCSSLTRSAWRMGSFLVLAGEPGVDVLGEGRAGNSGCICAGLFDVVGTVVVSPDRLLAYPPKLTAPVPLAKPLPVL